MSVIISKLIGLSGCALKFLYKSKVSSRKHCVYPFGSFVYSARLFTSIQLLDKMNDSLQRRGPVLLLIFKEKYDRKKSTGLGVFCTWLL